MPDRLDTSGLRPARHKIGMTQEELAKATGLCVRTVRRWEEDHRLVGPAHWAPHAMATALLDAGAKLTLTTWKPKRRPARPSGPVEFARLAIIADARAADEAGGILYGSNRMRCGARTRTGKPCVRKVVPGKRRCPNHGGLSTGPKTSAGRAAIAEANRARAAQR